MPILPSFFLSLLVLQLNISYRRITRFWKKKIIEPLLYNFQLKFKISHFYFQVLHQMTKSYGIIGAVHLYLRSEWKKLTRIRRRDILSTPGWVSAWLGGNWRGVYTHTKLNCHSFHRVPTWTCANLKLQTSSSK